MSKGRNRRTRNEFSNLEKSENVPCGNARERPIEARQSASVRQGFGRHAIRDQGLQTAQTQTIDRTDRDHSGI